MTRHRRCSIVASAIVLLLPALIACNAPQTTPNPLITSAPPPTHTAVPTNTPQPAPTPTELPPDVEEEALIVLQHTSYTDSSGNMHVVGQVYNNTEQNLAGVQVKGLFYDKDDQLLAEKVTFAHAEILPPSHRAPFALTLFDPAQTPETYALEVSGKETDNAPFQALELVQHALLNDDESILVLGEIRNANEQSASKVRVAATLYDAAGQIIDVAFTFLQREVLKPGASVPFEIHARAANGTPNHYRVTAYGDGASEAELDRQATPKILSTRHYRDDYNGLVIVGEMLNTEDTHVTFAKALVSFYDPNGQLIAARWSYAWAKILEPQGRSPFRVRLIEPLDRAVTWAVQVEGEKTEDAPQGQLVLEDKQNAIDAENVSTFAGTVRNAGSEAMEAIEIAATVYDAAGNVAAVGWVSLEGALAPGERAPFELKIQVTEDAQGFRLSVQGKATQ
jgi:hypothetical protein